MPPIIDIASYFYLDTKRKPITSWYFKDFLELYHNRSKENERWRKFSLSEIEARDYNLNIKWIKSDNFDDPADLPEPEELISESIQGLGGALMNLEHLQNLDNTITASLNELIQGESGLPEWWEMVELQDVAEINPKKSEVRHLPDELEVSFVPMASVSEKTWTIENAQTKRIWEVRNGYTYFSEGDVLFAKITPCMENGKSAIASNLKNAIGFGTTEFHVIRPKNRLKAEFIHAILRDKSFRYEAEQNMTWTAGQARVPVEFLKSYQIPLPPISEQEKIVATLSEIKNRSEKNLLIYEQAAESIRKLQQSILKKVLSWQLW